MPPIWRRQRTLRVEEEQPAELEDLRVVVGERRVHGEQTRERLVELAEHDNHRGMERLQLRKLALEPFALLRRQNVQPVLREEVVHGGQKVLHPAAVAPPIRRHWPRRGQRARLGRCACWLRDPYEVLEAAASCDAVTPLPGMRAFLGPSGIMLTRPATQIAQRLYCVWSAWTWLGRIAQQCCVPGA